jgi:hypothetical protein
MKLIKPDFRVQRMHKKQSYILEKLNSMRIPLFLGQLAANTISMNDVNNLLTFLSYLSLSYPFLHTFYNNDRRKHNILILL